ncbi:MAG TPA: outer membrane beta-barrel protein [Terracidiphilus sp.]|nr:outer membrane beta-barrel protein [Terracidiphilus sp.]
MREYEYYQRIAVTISFQKGRFPMKRLLLVSAALLMIVAIAPAANSQASSSQKPATALPWDWNGFYVGGHLGGVWPHLNITDVGYNGYSFAAAGTAGQVFHAGNTAILGGGQVGWDHQQRSLVYGIEGAFGWMNLNGSTLDPGTASNTQAGMNAGMYENVAGRFGKAFGPALLYGKGGLALFQGDRTFSSEVTDITSITHNSVFYGYVAGGGVEYHLKSNWFAKVEYLHQGFASQTYNVVTSSGGPWPFKEQFSGDTVNVGFNYKFHCKSPAKSKH